MEIIGFVVIILLGANFILVGLVVGYIALMGFGVSSKLDALPALVPIAIGAALLYYGISHSPFELVVKHVYT